jgi:hypothetical protein
VISPIERPSDDQRFALDALRDGVRRYAYTGSARRDDSNEVFFGYVWRKPVRAAHILYHAGPTSDEGGRFDTLRVESLGPDGQWSEVVGVVVTPEFSPVLVRKGDVEFHISFPPIESKGIRIIGRPGEPNQQVTIRELIVR